MQSKDGAETFVGNKEQVRVIGQGIGHGQSAADREPDAGLRRCLCLYMAYKYICADALTGKDKGEMGREFGITQFGIYGANFR